MATFVRRSLLGLIGVALAAIWLASAGANFGHGVQLASHSPYWWVFGLASASMDVIKASALVGLTAAWQRKRFSTAVVACLLLWVVAAAWGIKSCLGFVSTTLSDTVSERTMHGVADVSLKRQLDDQLTQVTKLQDAKVRAPAKDWDRIEAEIGRTEERISKLQRRAQEARTVGAADPVADMLHVSEEMSRTLTAILFLAGVEICASLGLVGFLPLFGTRHDVAAKQLVRAAGAEPRSKRSKRQSAPAAPRSKEDHPPVSDHRVQATALVERLVAARGPGTRVPAEEAFAAYDVLAAERGWSRLPNNKIGGQFRHLGVTKDETNRNAVVYVLPQTEREENEEAPSKRGAAGG
jgi:hypothetical protein